MSTSESTSEKYPGENALISYIKKQNVKASYWEFLNNHRDIIVTSTLTNFSENWKYLNNRWTIHFLSVGKNHPDFKDKITTEYLRYAKRFQIFWQEIIKECKVNYAVISHSPAKDYSKTSEKDDIKLINTITSHPPAKDHSKKSKKDIKLINFCYDILHELKNKFNNNPLYRFIEKEIISNEIIKHPMDLSIIYSKLENDQYTTGILEEFEKDIRLIICNCYTYNEIESDMYNLGEKFELAFNKIWTKVIIFQDEVKEKLKRKRNNDNDESVIKQIQILDQNKNKLVYKQVINNAIQITLAYEELVKGNISPFIKLLKSFLLTRSSQMSLSTTNEPVLQAIIESFLPPKCYIPELSLVMNGKLQKKSGRYGFSDIFILGNNYICLELKYVSLKNLLKNEKNEFEITDLKNLDEIIEKEDEKFLLKRHFTYWSENCKELKQMTIYEILNNGINQLKSYMKIISKGEPIDYFDSGIIDKRIKITKSKNSNNKLKGFVILVIGFRRIIWKSVDDLTSNYIYDQKL